MMRSLTLLAVSCIAMLSVGCGGSGQNNPIRAAVPGGGFGQSHRVHQSGTYTLYHVTHWNDSGQPVNAQKLASVSLRANDRVGFEYRLNGEQRWQPDAESDIIAYAGDQRMNLGPLRSMTEKYFWVKQGEWNSYWSTQPERTITKAVTLQ